MATTPRLPLVALLAALVIPAVNAAEVHLGNRDTPGLIKAIERANSQAGRLVIHLAPGGIYTLGEPEAGQTLPIVQGRLQVIGNGAEIRRYAAGAVTLFEVEAGGSLSLHDLTLAEGSHGALRNHGKLRLERVSVVDSTATEAQAVVVNFGQFEAEDSRFAFNQVLGGGRDVAVLLNHGDMLLQRVQIDGNTVSRRFPTLVAVAGVLNYGQLQMFDVSFDHNEVSDGFGGLGTEGVALFGNSRLRGDLDPRHVRRLDSLPRPFAPIQGYVGR
jgi:hypothetical protein